MRISGRLSVGTWARQWVDYYEALGVSPKATPNVIKAAYRAMALDFHPDRNPDDAERMKRINIAHDVLSDPECRRRYDIAYEARKHSSDRSAGSESYRQTTTPPSGPSARQQEDAAREAHRKQASENETRRKAADDEQASSATRSASASAPTQPQFSIQPLLVWGGALIVLAALWIGMSGEDDADVETGGATAYPTTASPYQQYVFPTSTTGFWVPPAPIWRPATNTPTPLWRPRATPAPFWIPPTPIPRPTVVPPSREETMASHATATARAEVMATKETIQNNAALARAYKRMETAAQNNRWSIAVDEADRILAEQPDYRDVNEKRPVYFNMLYEAAVTTYNEERWDEAVKMLSQLKRLEPSNADIRQMANAAEREARKQR
ncbi:hypothetical protein BH23CHL1_BH23CHL1_14580 [soil metagenome]